MVDANVPRFLLPVGNCTIDHTPAKELFQGFTQKEIRNCAEKILKLTDFKPSSPDVKPLAQIEYKDISNSLEQKLFNFYLYKKNQSQNTFARKSQMVISTEENCSISLENFSHQDRGKLRKRKYSSNCFQGDVSDETLAIKKRKLNCGVNNGRVTNHSHLHIAERFVMKTGNSFFETHSVLSCAPVPPIKSSLLDSTNFSVVRQWQNPLNMCSATNHKDLMSSSLSATPKSMNLRESKLSLRNDDLEKLKENLIETLRHDMKEDQVGHFKNSDVDDKLRNLSKLMQNSDISESKCIVGEALPSTFYQKLDRIDMRGIQNTNQETIGAAVVKESEKSTDTSLFESLSEKILYEVRKLMASSQLYSYDVGKSSTLNEMVKNDGFISLPESGTAIITSSCLLDVSLCFACGSAGRLPEDKLLFCNECCEPFHRYCLEFRITEANKSSWLCTRCQKNVYLGMGMNSDAVVKELVKILNDKNCHDDGSDSKFKCKRRCALCFKAGDLPSNLGGRLVYIGSNHWVHVNCILWSEGVRELRDGHLVNVRQTISNSKFKPCSHCNRPGASLKCSVRQCLKRFHFSCAVACHCSFGKNFHFHCPKHASILHRNNITSIFCVKRKIFAADPEESTNFDFIKKSISIGNFKLISLKNGSRSQNGYRSRRRFWSTRDPRKLCTYFCSIFEKKHTISEVCIKAGTNSKIVINETEKRTVRENLRRHLMELKRIKMVENRKCFPKLAQLDGTAGFDSDEDNDDTMNFEDFSNSNSHDNSQQSNASPITSSGNPIISFHALSAFSTPLKSNIIVSSNSHDVIVTTNLSFTTSTCGNSDSSKLDTPNKSFKVSAIPAQQYRGQISYLGSVVAANLQSLLKPKQSSMNSNQFPKACSDAAHSSNDQETLKLTQSSYSMWTNDVQNSNKLSNLTSFANSSISNPALNADLSSPLQSKQNSLTAAVTPIVNSSRLPSPFKPKTFTKSLETGTITSSVNSSMKSQVQFLGSIPSANLQAFLKSKIGKSLPLNNNNSFPNLPLMGPLNVQNTGSHSDLNSSKLSNSSNNISYSVSPFTTANSHVSLQATALNTDVLPSAKITCNVNVGNSQCPALTTNNLTYVNSNISINSLKTSKQPQNVSETNSNLLIPRSVLSNDRSLTKMATEHLLFPVNQSTSTSCPTTELIDEVAASRVTTSVDTGMVSSSPTRSAILKPAAGFDKPRPFTSNELMFTDSEEEDQDGIINSKVFSDFDDFVRNFETRTNMPMLKLKRCDHMITPSLASPSFKTKSLSSSSESISSSHLNNLSSSSSISTIFPPANTEGIVTRNMTSEPLTSFRISSATKTSCLTNKFPCVSATKASSSTLFTPTCTSSAVQDPPSSHVLSTHPSPLMHASNMLPSCSVQNLKSTLPSSNISSHLGLAIISPLTTTEVTSFSSSSLSSHKFTMSEGQNSTNNCTPRVAVSLIDLQKFKHSSDNGSLKPPVTVSVNSEQVMQPGLSSSIAKLSNGVGGNEICDNSDYSIVNNSSRSYSKEGNSNSAPSEKMVVFEIKSSDGFSCSGSSAEEAWSKMKTELDSSRRKLSLRPISLGGMRGLTFFGLDHPVVINLIHNCADKSSSQVSRKDSVDLVEVKEGCARFKPFSQRKPLDVFHFLLSEHRRTIKVSEPIVDSDDEFDRNRSALTSTDLPLSSRYKKMRSLSSVSVSVRRSRIHGRGLFAMHDIDNGEMVIEYCGQVIRSVLTDSREKMYESKGIGCYMFKVDDSKVVDATMRGNAARFINHSCDPNCTSKIIHLEGRKHIVICATRFIRKGEELTYNYKFPIEEGNKIPCCCGSRKCKKFMN